MVEDLLSVGPDDQVMTERGKREVFAQLLSTIGGAGAWREHLDDHQRVGNRRAAERQSFAAVENGVRLIVAVADLDGHPITVDVAW